MIVRVVCTKFSVRRRSDGKESKLLEHDYHESESILACALDTHVISSGKTYYSSHTAFTAVELLVGAMGAKADVAAARAMMAAADFMMMTDRY